MSAPEPSSAPQGPAPSAPLELLVYTASGCSLCDDAHAVLERLAPELNLEVRWESIEHDPRLEARWRTEIPVGFLAGRKVFKYIVDEPFLRRKVARLRA